ncbi:hypothetical protein HNY73_023231 [Argiope bruennichi]|uniref:Uncharacterized protein n=1 Tax=Argiope bruennichi TaxID=94029 RepID=A0A8T0E4R3_ARGBR|nr:hypothetical protein HNY73_023231 [Argiope bruennichi]
MEIQWECTDDGNFSFEETINHQMKPEAQRKSDHSPLPMSNPYIAAYLIFIASVHYTYSVSLSRFLSFCSNNCRGVEQFSLAGDECSQKEAPHLPALLNLHVRFGFVVLPLLAPHVHRHCARLRCEKNIQSFWLHVLRNHGLIFWNLRHGCSQSHRRASLHESLSSVWSSHRLQLHRYHTGSWETEESFGEVGTRVFVRKQSTGCGAQASAADFSYSHSIRHRLVPLRYRVLVRGLRQSGFGSEDLPNSIRFVLQNSRCHQSSHLLVHVERFSARSSRDVQYAVQVQEEGRLHVLSVQLVPEVFELPFSFRDLPPFVVAQPSAEWQLQNQEEGPQQQLLHQRDASRHRKSRLMSNNDGINSVRERFGFLSFWVLNV